MNTQEIIDYLEKTYKGKRSYYIQIPKDKVGKLGGFTTLGYVSMFTPLGELKPVYYACKELRDILRSFQYHVCYMDTMNKTANERQKICKFKTLKEAIQHIQKFN